MSKRNRERRAANRRSPPPKTNPRKGFNHSAYRDNEPKQKRTKSKPMMEPAVYMFASGQGTTVEQVNMFRIPNVDQTGQLDIWDWNLGWPG